MSDHPISYLILALALTQCVSGCAQTCRCAVELRPAGVELQVEEVEVIEAEGGGDGSLDALIEFGRAAYRVVEALL